jgi:YVTN family beta-propeller protein
MKRIICRMLLIILLSVVTGLPVFTAFAAQTPSPALLVLNKEENTLAIVNPATGNVVGRVETGGSPHEVTVSSDGKLAFTSNYGRDFSGRTLSVIDLIAQKELHRVDISPLRGPHGLFYSGGRLYFTAEVNKALGGYDPATNRVDWLLGIGQNRTHMVLFSKDRNTIFTSNINSNTISIIGRVPAPTFWNVTVVPVGKEPEGFDVSPDGKSLWAADSGDGHVTIIDIASKKVTGTINVQTRHSNRLKFTPDGKRVLISDLGSGELVVMDVATRRVIKRMKLGHTAEGILIPPSGARAYVALGSDNRVAIIDLKTLSVAGHLHTGRGPDGMAWAVRR